MDLFDLLILSLFALPALLRWIEQSRKRGQQEGAEGSQPPPTERVDRRSEFERALEEIGLTLQGKPAPPRPSESARTRSADAANGGFSREESFEVTPGSRAPGAMPFRKLRKVEITSPYTRPTSTRRKQAHRVRRVVRSASRAREAILLSEVLGPPAAFRSRRRGW